MVNKKGMWFLTLFSLILVLGVYYATMPSDNNLATSIEKSANEIKEEVGESSILVALRVEKEEQLLEQLDELNDILTSKATTVDEKNKAYEQMKKLNTVKAEEEQIETKLNNELKIECFVKVSDDKIKVVVTNQTQSVSLANKIMNCVKSNYSNDVYVTVEFK